MKLPASLVSLILFTSLVGLEATANDYSAGDSPVVIGELNLAEVESHIEQVEKAFFDRFNALVTDEDLKIRCNNDTFTGSRIVHQRCIPVFHSKADTRYQQTSRFELSGLRAGKVREAELEEMYQAFESELQRVLAESSHLRELNDVLGALRTRLAELES